MPDTIEKTSVPGAAAVNAPADQVDKPRSLWSDAWGDLRRRPVFVLSALLILLLIAISIAPGLFTSVDPRAGDLRTHYLTTPSWSHVFQPDWFGYDGQGRSIY